MQTSSMPDAKTMGIGHGYASNASRTIQITSRLVRVRVHQVGKILSKETGGRMRATVAQDGIAADGMQIIDEINLGAQNGPDRLSDS